MTKLELVGVTVAFGGLTAVSNVSLAVPAGRIHGIIGPNGAGKTSLLNAICGVVRPSAGRILLDGSPIQGLRPHEIAARKVFRTFQTSRMFQGMSVLENVITGLHRDLGANLLTAALGTRRVRAEEEEAAHQARATLDFVGMGSFCEHEATTLSFGQQRLVEIARALVGQPQVLLLDEPAVGLNVRRIADLDRLLRRIRDERGVTIIMIEHVLRLVMEVCDEVTVLSSGQVIAGGTPKDVTRDPQVIEAYLGKSRNAVRAAS